MPKFEVELSDGRKISTFAPDDAGAKKQALHHETSRIQIAALRRQPVTVSVAFPVNAVKVKD